MPRYISPLGFQCTAEEALLSDGRLRPGYSNILEDGETLHFNVHFRDAAPAAKATVFLHDDVALKATVDRLQALHDQKFAFMGDRAPKFNRENALAVERAKASVSKTSVVRDAVRDGRFVSHGEITVAGRVPVSQPCDLTLTGADGNSEVFTISDAGLVDLAPKKVTAISAGTVMGLHDGT